MSNTIDNENTKHAPPTYVTQYQMTREPFGETIENDLYYAEPGRQQKLDILLHLTQYGNELVIVTGPTGSGKTTLLHQYLNKGLDTWSVAHIDAQNGIDERKLLQQLFHQMGMEFHGATHLELFKRMKHHFDALQHNARQAVMLVDNAEQVPVTALKRILEMAELTSADNKPLLRVILFGTNRLNENFDDPLLEQYDHVIRRNVELMPFDQEHTTHYILHRLSAANISENKPFTDAVMHKIYKQSNGWPGRINLLAHNTLLETLPVGGLNQDGASTINPRHLGIALAGFVLVGVLFFFQEHITGLIYPAPTETNSLPVAPAQNEENEQSSISSTDALIADATPADESPAVETSPVLPGTDTRGEESNTFIDDTFNDTQSNDTQTSPNAEAETPVSMGEPAPLIAETADSTDRDQPQPEAILPVATKPAIAPAQNTTDQQTTTTQVVTSVAARIPDNLPGKRAAWIRQQNPAHFTLQLVAGNNLKTLRNYISKHQPTGTLAIYQTTRKGQPWFGLIQQSFPSKQAAIDARSKLPATMRKQQPWVRSFDSLHKDLDTTLK